MLRHEVRLAGSGSRTGLAERPDVVVAVDGGWGSRRALEQAGREADLRGAGLVVVTVRTTPRVEPTGYAAWARAERDAADHATRCQFLRAASRSGCPTRVAVRGVVASCVDDLSLVAAHAGLLVLGRSGASGQGVFRMGTTSGELVTVFGCPVLCAVTSGPPVHRRLRRRRATLRWSLQCIRRRRYRPSFGQRSGRR